MNPYTKMIAAQPPLPAHAPARPGNYDRPPDRPNADATAYMTPPLARGPGMPSRVPAVMGPDSWRQTIPGERMARSGQTMGAPHNRGTTPAGRGSIAEPFPPSYGGQPPAQGRPQGPPSPMAGQSGYTAARTGQMPGDFGGGGSQAGRGASVRSEVFGIAARNRRG